MSHPTLPDIRVAALAYVRDRRLLMVTARGRDVFFLPGGKIDAGESPEQAVVREVREEVGVELVPDTVRLVTELALQAHGEPEGRLVAMSVFTGDLRGEPTASAEVNSVHWVTVADAHRCPPAGAAVLEHLHEHGIID